MSVVTSLTIARHCLICPLQLTVAAYIRKSFIAAYIGNIVGALFVAIPAIYFYLSDSSVDALHGAEQGNVLTEKQGNGASSTSSQGKPSEWCRFVAVMQTSSSRQNKYAMNSIQYELVSNVGQYAWQIIAQQIHGLYFLHYATTQ